MKRRQMPMPETLRRRLFKYRFEIRHVIVLFAVLITFQIVLALYQKATLGDFLESTQSWFQKYYAERIAIVTASSLELLFQNQQKIGIDRDSADNSMVYSVNIFLKQQRIQRSIEDIVLILARNQHIYVITNGQDMRDFLKGTLPPYVPEAATSIPQSMRYFLTVQDDLRRHEKIMSVLNNQRTFDVAVPFVPEGEYLGALYMRVTPDFTFLTEEVSSNFGKSSFFFSALIVVGLIGIFVVSSQAVQERDDMQRRLFAEHEEYLSNQIRLEKESLFTKRIYHTHHKAEKIMGFIKADVRAMNQANLEEMKKRVVAYSNFISRIIYDMKWYDPDINTIVNPIFKTDINAVIEFIVDHVFLRISSKNDMFVFTKDLDRTMPLVHVNEFIVWEILEPLIQNSIDHGGRDSLAITVRTEYDPAKCQSTVTIEDNGVGIREELLAEGERGIRRLFLEQESTKRGLGVHSGYGCYIAYQLAVGKCGWKLDAMNLPGGGCRFTITVRNGVLSRYCIEQSISG